MIWGRPPNLVLGAFTALFNVVGLVLSANGHPLPSGVTEAVNIAAASVITLIAYQPPTLNPGDTFRVTTPEGQPTATTTVATPPAHDPPPVPDPKP